MNFNKERGTLLGRIKKIGGGKSLAKYTDFGKAVKRALIDREKNGVWLVARVRELTGLYFDDAYLSKVLTGQLSSPKIIQAIQEILSIPDAPQA